MRLSLEVVAFSNKKVKYAAAADFMRRKLKEEKLH
jgi:hypothetical protein